MFNLNEEASGIIAALKNVTGIGTVDYLDALDTDGGDGPATFPAALLALEQIQSRQQSTFPSSPLSWAVVVKGKSHEGDNLLGTIDLIINALDGLEAVSTGTNFLQFSDLSFFERKPGNIAYKIVFTAQSYGRSRTRIQ